MQKPSQLAELEAEDNGGYFDLSLLTPEMAEPLRLGSLSVDGVPVEQHSGTLPAPLWDPATRLCSNVLTQVRQSQGRSRGGGAP